jgi:hypothetical protein
VPADTPRARREARADDDAFSERAPTQRPGLGTRFGETRYSRVNNAPFDRATPEHPFARLKVFYNDRDGIDEMLRHGRFDRRRAFSVAGGRFDVRIQSASGRSLPSVMANGRRYVQGVADRRYRIVIDSHSPHRVEAVISVDGLDVIDGRSASLDKRGYLLAPFGSLTIDGFRRSMDTIATFRFGSVRDSYAVRKHGSSRNVGVIGVAVFHEVGTSRFDWRDWRGDSHRRHRADPFPGPFAAPPGS